MRFEIPQLNSTQPFRLLSQEPDKWICKQQNQGNDETVDTCCLCNGCSQKHCADYVALCLRLSSNTLCAFSCRITLADSRSDTGYHGKAGSNCRACQH